jgi:hypothetical protein
MPLVQTRGAASAQGFGEFAQATVANYIEDVFSTYLYTGNGSTQTITNGIDLAGKGGLVWTKCRSVATDHSLVDTVRGADKVLHSESTEAQVTYADITAFNANGYGINHVSGWVNSSARTYASWTFREQPKFFDVVTYTGTGSNTTIAHSLGSVPGSIIVKRTDTTAAWAVYHRSLANTEYLVLNSTAVKATGATWWNSTTPTSAVFSVGTDASVNASGGTYVAYLFAHDAGGFGLTGTDNVISCGSYTGNGSTTGTLVNLGFEPQWLLVKMSSNSGYYWELVDNMRGIPTGGKDAVIWPNVSDAEYSGGQEFDLASNGFYPMGAASNSNVSGETYIYIAIRRGPMKVPTLGTSVFSADVATSGTVTTNFAVDSQIFYIKGSNDTIVNGTVVDRLRGVASTTTQQGNYLQTSSTNAELNTYPYMSKSWSNTGFGIPDNTGGTSSIYWSFKRAPGFFDVVCYTGTASNPGVLNHNLSVVPELMIVKCRSDANYWAVYTAFTGNTKSMLLPDDGAAAVRTTWNNTSPTATTFTVENDGRVYFSGATYVAYLFATCAGVSKVGSYTGNGTTQTINCGFTGGARFVLIKRTDSTGDWYVWDSARGIVAGNDPYLLLNSTAAEVTSTDYIDTASTGFEISSTAPAAINANGGSFIFLAIA